MVSRYTISSRSISSLTPLLACLLSIYLGSATTTVYAEQRSTTTTTNPQLHSPPTQNNVQTTILPLSANISTDIPPNTKDKVNEVNKNGGDEWKLLDGEFSSSDGVDNKVDKQIDGSSSNEQQSIISDASSAMAANYITKANYNPPVNNANNNGSSGANNGNSNTANSGGGWFGKILGKDKQSNAADSNAKVSLYECFIQGIYGDLLVIYVYVLWFILLSGLRKGDRAKGHKMCKIEMLHDWLSLSVNCQQSIYRGVML